MLLGILFIFSQFIFDIFITIQYCALKLTLADYINMFYFRDGNKIFQTFL